MSSNIENMGANLDHVENTEANLVDADNRDQDTRANSSQEHADIIVEQERAENPNEHQAECDGKLKQDGQETEKGNELVEKEDVDVDKVVSVGTSTVLIETQEVVSSTTSANQEVKPAAKKMRSAPRRGSYQPSRGYAGNFQNYGLAYLPYKSNFEPSEDARRRADEFLKTLKL